MASVADHPNYVFERVDIRDRAALEAVFAKHTPDAIMHLAAESHVDRSIDGPADFIETNVNGTFNMLETARSYWQAQGKPEEFRFHHVSTDEVFGSLGPMGMFTENTPYDPKVHIPLPRQVQTIWCGHGMRPVGTCRSNELF